MLLYIYINLNLIIHMTFCVQFWSFEFDDCKEAAVEKDKPADVIPTEYRVKRVVWFLLAGFALGLLPLVALPMQYGLCPSTPECDPSQNVVGTCVAVVHPDFDLAFQDLVASRKLIERARPAKGNLGYELIKDLQTPNTYRFIEHWDSKANLQAWMAHISPLFQEPAMKNLLVGGGLQQFGLNTYYQPSSCRKDTWGAVDIRVNASCDKVWSVVSNWSDCTWVIGCDYAVIGVKEPNVRELHMKNGATVSVVLRKLDANGPELMYEVLRPFSYTGSLKISSSGSTPGCGVRYRFTVPRDGQISADAVYADFLNIRVPALQQLFK